MGRKNKYNNFPPRLNVPVGGVCALCQCSRQIRKAAHPYVIGQTTCNRLGFPIQVPLICPGMKFTGLNNQTGEEETFEVRSVLINFPQFSVVRRIA